MMIKTYKKQSICNSTEERPNNIKTEDQNQRKSKEIGTWKGKLKKSKEEFPKYDRIGK